MYYILILLVLIREIFYVFYVPIESTLATISALDKLGTWVITHMIMNLKVASYLAFVLIPIHSGDKMKLVKKKQIWNNCHIEPHRVFTVLMS